MSNDKKNEFSGELLPPEVIRKGVYELGKVARIPPTVGIFDNPTRCFVVNVEWWSHIAGMVHLLADVVSWKDADDESYFAITEILKFMQGVECMDFALRQSPTDSCIMQQTLDGGTTWTDIFDFSECVTIQDKSITVTIQNQITTYQPTFQEIYNNFVANYAGTPESVYPDLAPTGVDDAALNAAYCNAVYELVKKACESAVAFYNDVISGAQQDINFGLGVAAFVVTAIALAGAIPTAGASLSALAAAAPLYAAAIGLSNYAVNELSNVLRNHNKEMFLDEAAQIDVTCYIIASCPPADNSLACMQNAADGITGDPNGQAILDFLKVLLSHESTYAAFLEKWNNNKQYADVGIEMDCPCETWDYTLWEWDFGTRGQGDFVLNSGTLFTGGRIQGVGTNDSKLASITLPDHDTTYRIKSIRVTYERVNGDGVGGLGHNRAEIYVNGYSGSNLANCGNGLGNGADLQRAFTNVSYITGGTSLGFFFVADTATADVVQIYIDKIEIVYMNEYDPFDAHLTEDSDLCP